MASRIEKKSLKKRLAYWLEIHWVNPAYAGWLLGGLTLFFFGAATNTMAGWLYVISGVSCAILALAAILPWRSLRELNLHRHPLEPVSVGENLTVEIEVENQSKHKKTLLQVRDMIPFVWGKPIQAAIEEIPENDTYRWVYYLPMQRRGIYRWHEVQVRTGTPLGLFWCRRSRHAPATAIIYPEVVNLTNCPLVDRMGAEDSFLVHSERRFNMATEGITRTVRPYRIGDPTRLIHWRTSARYGELRVRELETATGGQELIVALDSASSWDLEQFEQAAIAAASLFFYADRAQLNVRLWTAGSGLIHGNHQVLEALAATDAGEDAIAGEPPFLPLIWLTQNPHSLDRLPRGSRYVLWPRSQAEIGTILANANFPGIEILPDKPLQLQLQSPLR